MKCVLNGEGDGVVLVAPEHAIAQWRELIAQFDRRVPVLRRTYSAGHFGPAEVAKLIEATVRPLRGGSGDRWRVVQDELLGSLIVTATEREHGEIETLIGRLNAMPAGARRPVRTYVIRNRDVLELVEVLQRLVDANVLTGDIADGAERSPSEGSVPANEMRQTPPNGGGSPDLRHGRGQRDDGGHSAVSLAPDAFTNTLIAIGEPRLLDQLEALIRTLDVRQAQVEIEAMMVSLNESEAIDLGVELQKLEVSGGTLFGLSSLFGLSRIGIDSNSPLTGGRGGSGVILSPGDFSVVVRALENIQSGSTKTFPKVLVNNNKQATLDSVVQQPFTSTNASDTVATTSFGGTLDAGTQVTITPQIAEGDHLVLEYSISLSSFIGESSDPNLPPPRQETRLQTVVTIPDGHAIAVGGLEVRTDAQAVTQVPLLGDIPLLGEIFKNRSNSESRTRFYVFIRANILRHPDFDDLRYRSERSLRAAGVDDGFPTLAPRIIY